ncbi:MAG: hypothetical protein ABW107_19250, partial [Candidatus Thiodiazotropha sp. 6PLUC5]
ISGADCSASEMLVVAILCNELREDTLGIRVRSSDDDWGRGISDSIVCSAGPCLCCSMLY